MAGGYSHQPVGVDGFAAVTADLQRQINELRGAAASRSTTIVDEAGSPQIHLGKLATGGFGIEQKIADDWVPLAQLAGGAQAATVSGTKTIIVDALGSSSWETGDGDVTFTTYTGKWLLLMIAATVDYYAATADLGFSSTGAQQIEPDDARRARLKTKGTEESSSQVYAELILGDPGQITVSPRYKAYSTQNYEGYVEWTNRATIVLPF